MSDEIETKFSERLILWESLEDNSNEKIKFLARFNGDNELAKWAFIREVDESSSTKRLPQKTIKLINHKSLPNPVRRVLSGNFPFWGGFVFLVIIPNIVFKSLTAGGNLSGTELRYALTFYLLFSILSVGLLFLSARRMVVEEKKFAKIAMVLVGLSAISVVYNGPIAIEVITSQKSLNTRSSNFNSGTSGFGSGGFGSGGFGSGGFGSGGFGSGEVRPWKKRITP
jgi:uncharacterized membrane protein YgcG